MRIVGLASKAEMTTASGCELTAPGTFFYDCFIPIAATIAGFPNKARVLYRLLKTDWTLSDPPTVPLLSYRTKTEASYAPVTVQQPRSMRQGEANLPAAGKAGLSGEAHYTGSELRAASHGVHARSYPTVVRRAISPR